MSFDHQLTDADRLDADRLPHIGRSVSLDHAAQMLGVSRRTIYNRIRQGRLQTIRTIGGSQRVLLDALARNARCTADRSS
jgi:excisionase family DNA binding protein